MLKRLSPLNQLAARIDAHLKRFEADPKINVYRDGSRAKRELKPYYNSGAFCVGRYVMVRYISYQGTSSLTRAEAERYADMLDAGFVGRHFEALR